MNTFAKIISAFIIGLALLVQPVTSSYAQDCQKIEDVQKVAVDQGLSETIVTGALFANLSELLNAQRGSQFFEPETDTLHIFHNGYIAFVVEVGKGCVTFMVQQPIPLSAVQEMIEKAKERMRVETKTDKNG